MSTATLVPWTCEQAVEGGTAWGFAGTAAAALRAAIDGNYAAVGIVNGQADSNSLRAKQWRVAGSGAVFDWSNKTITSVAVALNILNNGPEGTYFIAVVSANEPLSYAEQVFNGQIFTAPGAASWVEMGGVNQASVKAALLADNYLISLIHYNHSLAQATITADAMRAVVTYTDNIRAGLQHAMEA